MKYVFDAKIPSPPKEIDFGNMMIGFIKSDLEMLKLNNKIEKIRVRKDPFWDKSEKQAYEAI